MFLQDFGPIRERTTRGVRCWGFEAFGRRNLEISLHMQLLVNIPTLFMSPGLEPLNPQIYALDSRIPSLPCGICVEATIGTRKLPAAAVGGQSSGWFRPFCDSGFTAFGFGFRV